MTNRLSDAEKARRAAYRTELRRQLASAVRIQADIVGEIRRLLAIAEQRIVAAIGRGSAFEVWRLTQIQAEVRAAMTAFEPAGTATLQAGADRLWRAGSDLVIEPLRAAEIDLTARLTTLDTRLLTAMKAFSTDRIRDISITSVNRINTELSQALIGVQSPLETAQKIAPILGAGGDRARTIVRTELGAVYAEAGQQRMEQAVALGVRGLKKQWRRSGKRHPRVTHELADGQVVDVHEPFLVGGVKIMKPRDPSLAPKDRINCGCASLPYMASWAVSHPGPKPYTDAERATSTAANQVEEVRAELARRRGALRPSE